MPFDLDLSKAQPLLTRISNVFSPAVADQILVYAGDRVGAKADELIQDDLYPPASGKALPLYYTRQRTNAKGETESYQSKFKSLAQQRYVMMLAKKGLIPWKRTGKLGQSIAWQVALQGSGIVMVRIGSDLTYSLYVVDMAMQSFYHKGVWSPLQSSVMDNVGALNAVAVNAIISQVNKRIKGNG